MTMRKDLTGSTFFKRLSYLTRRTDRRTRGGGAWLRRRLAVGLLVAFPLVVTALFANFMFNLLDRWFRPISERIFGMQIVGAGLVLTLLGLLLLGIVATNVLGSRILGFFESRVLRVPLLSPIYQGARQITEAIQVRGTTEFRRVVLVAFPHPDIQSIGFVTREFPHPTGFSSEGSALVFVPTTPNPTSGFLVSVRLRDLKPLEITVEEGVKLVISGGLLTPERVVRRAAAMGHSPTTTLRDQSSDPHPWIDPDEV
jgi:uncharacterized membrane protein